MSRMGSMFPVREQVPTTKFSAHIHASHIERVTKLLRIKKRNKGGSCPTSASSELVQVREGRRICSFTLYFPFTERYLKIKQGSLSIAHSSAPYASLSSFVLRIYTSSSIFYFLSELHLCTLCRLCLLFHHSALPPSASPFV